MYAADKASSNITRPAVEPEDRNTQGKQNTVIRFLHARSSSPRTLTAAALFDLADRRLGQGVP